MRGLKPGFLELPFLSLEKNGGKLVSLSLLEVFPILMLNHRKLVIVVVVVIIVVTVCRISISGWCCTG